MKSQNVLIYNNLKIYLPIKQLIKKKFLYICLMIDIQKFHKESLHNLSLNGVYKIVTKHNNLIYIGSTGQVSKYKKWTGFKLRWLHHLSSLLLNKHKNIRLQRTVNKYGIEDLEFSILEITSPKEAIVREQYWIDYYDSFNNGLNLRPKAESNLGKKDTQETKDKRAKSLSKVLKEKWSKEIHPRVGFIMSDIQKKNLSLSKRSLSDEKIKEVNLKLKFLLEKDFNKANAYKQIEKDFGVKIDTLRRLIKGKWNDLDWSFICSRKQKCNNVLLSKIWELKLKKYTEKMIAEELQISQQLVNIRIKEIVKSKL